MYKQPPRFTTGQELATRYWWNITQLAAAASQDIFLIMYSSMDGTENGTKSIWDYCVDNGMPHMTQELVVEGYDEKKLTSDPNEVFFDLQLTRKVLDKVIFVDYNRDILEKIRKKIRWLTHQRNEVCHETLSSLELQSLRFKLGNVKGVIRQLYNLASRFSNINRETTNEALEFYLDELEVHRSLTTVTQWKSIRRFRNRRVRRYAETEESSDSDEDSEENENNISEDQWSSDKDRNSPRSGSINSSESSDAEGTKNVAHYMTNKSYEDISIMEKNNNIDNIAVSYETEDLESYCVKQKQQENSDKQGDSQTNPYTEGNFHELWQAQGSSLLVQVGLYCSKGWQNQFENIHTILTTGEQFMLFWQRCQCEDHLKQAPCKVRVVPPKLDIRTRSKSLGRKASWYLLNRQRLNRRKYKRKRDKLSQEKRSLFNIMKQVESCVPEIQRGVFGNKWEDIVRREEAIVAIENWDILIQEEEWKNEGWIDIQDFKVPYKTSKEEGTQTIQESTDEQNRFLISERESVTSEITDFYRVKTKKIFLLSFSIILLTSVLVISFVLFVIVAAFLTLALIGKVITEFFNILTVSLFMFNIGCVVFILFLIMKFLLIVVVSLVKIASVLLYFIQFCTMIEQQSSEAVQRLTQRVQQ